MNVTSYFLIYFYLFELKTEYWPPKIQKSEFIPSLQSWISEYVHKEWSGRVTLYSNPDKKINQKVAGFGSCNMIFRNLWQILANSVDF